MPQFQFVQPVALLGSVATGAHVEIDPYTNELLAQIDTITCTAPAAGVYTIQIVGEEGTFQVSVTMGGAETAAQFVAAWVVAFDADPDLLNIVNAVDADPDLVLNFIHTGQVWVTTLAADPGPDMTLVATQAAGGTDIGLGLVVVGGTDQTLAIAPTAGSVALDFLGVTERSLMSLVNTGISTDVDHFEPGDKMSVLREGDIWVFAEDAVTFNDPVFVRTTATGVEQFGAVRSDADGGDALTWPRAVFRDTSTASGLVRIRLNLP